LQTFIGHLYYSVYLLVICVYISACVGEISESSSGGSLHGAQPSLLLCTIFSSPTHIVLGDESPVALLLNQWNGLYPECAVCGTGTRHRVVLACSMVHVSHPSWHHNDVRLSVAVHCG